MFEFLFKRPGDSKPGDKQPAGRESRAEPGGAQGAGTAGAGAGVAPQRALQAEKLSRIQGDEAAAVDFILQCEFSELRLAAAESVQTPDALERVHAAMRNTDRRVAKLMQARLDAHRHHEAERRRAEALLAQARALLDDVLLTPNHVADLDRSWAVISTSGRLEEFGAVRTALGRRLDAQVQLQRAMIDRLANLRRLPSEPLPAAALAARLAELTHEQAQALSSPEQASLPRTLVAEVGLEAQKLQASLQEIAAGQAALAAHASFLAMQQEKPAAELDPQALRAEWHRLPQPQPGTQDVAMAALQQRFEDMLAAVPQPDARPVRGPAGAAAGGAPKPMRQDKARGADQKFLDTLDALEAALEQGSLGTAAELDKRLKDGRDKGMRLTPAQSERLADVRAELKRLSDWARWGGNISREELIKAVEALSTQHLAMGELARKIGTMRERWKTLDSLSGAAPKSLWERFDAACGAAYAPAAAHFRHLADERHANAARAQLLIDEANAEIARLQAGEWKHVAGTVQRLRLAWSHLGAIDRKEKKRLDALFADTLNILQGPLEEQRKDETAAREELIEAAAAIDPHGRHALDAMRALQQRWQEHARALPLERRAEQALWQRFRAVCNEVFQRRKESLHEADVERRAHEAAKEAISARLEAQAAGVDPAGAARLLREAQAEWQAIGPVPRAHEARIEQRYHAAIAQVRQHADAARRAAGQALAGRLRDKLRLVQELERALAGGAQPDAHPQAQREAVPEAEWEARWQALAPLDAELEQVLRARFVAALDARGDGREAYARLLERNRAPLLQDLLRAEIRAGIDSGPEFARERLKLQVEVLQASLGSGQGTGRKGDLAHGRRDEKAGAVARLRALVALPALVDARTASRLEQLLMRVAGEDT